MGVLRGLQYPALMHRRYLLVGNPTARSGKGLAHLDAILQHMRAIGADITLHKTLPDGKTPASVARAVDTGNWDVVIYAGGDGTFAEVAKGILLAARPVPMGLMPGGTANDQGQSFGLASGIAAVEQQVEVLLAHHVVHMDAGRLTRLGADDSKKETDLWFDNMGFGFAASVLATRNRDRSVVGKIPLLREIYRDQAVYAGAVVQEAIRSFVEPTTFDAEVRVDGELHTFDGLTDIVINNTPVFGGEWIPVRDATATDGQLDLIALRGQRQLLSSLVTDHKSTVSWDLPGIETTALRGKAFDITLFQPRGGDVPSQIDGEEWLPGTRFQVHVGEAVLPVIVPADFEPPWR